MRKNVPSKFTGVHIGIVICALMAACLFEVNGQAQLIKDVNTKENPYSSEYSSLTALGSSSYFISRGTELWKSTGTSSGTIKLKTFKTISSLTVVGSVLYFVADDGTSGKEIWKTNGTTSGTVRVKDLRAGATGSDPSYLINVNGVLYFAANNGTSGREIWKSDGTSAGTVLVKDVLTGSGSSNPSRLTNVNGTVYFNANNNVVGYELWKTTGTSASTVLVKDIKPGSKVGSHPELLTNANGVLYFVADDGTAGRELWKSNGTATGTVRVKDINAGTSGSAIDLITPVGSTVYFSAYTPTYGHELWKSNGTTTGTVQVIDGVPGTNGTALSNLTNINNALFYVGSLNGSSAIIRTDGTVAGTKAIAPAIINEYSVPFTYFTIFNGAVYYFNGYGGSPESASVGLYKTDPSGSTPSLVKLLYHDVDYRNSDYSPFPGQLIATTSTMYLTGRLEESHGFKLLKSDGTSAGTVVVKDTFIPTLGSDPARMVELNGIIYFSGQGFGNYDYYEEWSNQEMWKTDGTTAGTIRLKRFKRIEDLIVAGAYVFYAGLNEAENTYELWKANATSATLVKSFPASENRGFHGLTASVNGVVYFYTNLGEVWRTDGTTAGTTMMRDFHQVISITYAGGKTFILALTPSGGEELWKSIGTPATTTLVKVLRSGYGNISYLTHPRVTFNNAYYFIADDGIHNKEVWRSDGTAAGTYMAFDLRTNDTDYNIDIYTMFVFNGSLYISAKDADGVWAVFKSNGTAAGTVKLANLNYASTFATVNNKLLFLKSPAAGETFSELWTTDGTPAGTKMLKVLNEYSYVGGYPDFELVNNVLYFANPYSNYIWRSDGTECGTYSFVSGVLGATPMEAIGTNLIFGGWQYITEREIYRLNVSDVPASPCTTSIASTEEVEVLGDEGNETIAHYPNPFNQEITIRVAGAQGDRARISVFASNGAPIETFDNIECNTDYTIGRDWKAGLYILKVNTSAGMQVRKVVKR